MSHIYSTHPDIAKPFQGEKNEGIVRNAKRMHEIARARQKTDAKQKLLMDCNYYTTICFQSAEQLKAFCQTMGLTNARGGFYHLDGLELARKHNIALPEVDSEMLEKLWTKRPPKGFKESDVTYFDETKAPDENSPKFIGKISP